MMKKTWRRRLNAGLRQVMARTYYGTGRFKARLRGRVVILTYHRVLTQKELSIQFVQPGMYVLADVFENHMQFVREHFRILSIGELFQLWRNGGLDHRTRYCAVTFDDGWMDNYVHAYPVLRRLGIPATIFLPTGFVGTGNWFWPDRLAYLLRRPRSNGMLPSIGRAECTDHMEEIIERWKRMRNDEIETALGEMAGTLGASAPRERAVVDWEEVAEMARNGISFGSHSATHAILTNVTRGELKREIDDSLRVLRERSGNCIPVFCYPNGAYTDEVVDHVRAAGYIGAVTTDFGWEAGAPPDLFRVRRIGVHNDISRTTPLFAFHVSGLNRVLRGER
jgi:peptidoglycan/xylan/chitin deacetylase (PgdA/CDA1 family)